MLVMTACLDNSHLVGTSVAQSTGGAGTQDVTTVCSGQPENCVSADANPGQGGAGAQAAETGTKLVVVCPDGNQLTLHQSCQLDAECVVVWYYRDECGSRTGVGANLSDEAAFKQALSECKLIGCQSGEAMLETESGLEPMGSPPARKCVNQRCAVVPG
jgi:hypothetical protein